MVAPQPKSHLRRQARAARRALSPANQISHARTVARIMVGSGLLLRAKTIGAYLPNQADGELDPLPLISRLWGMGKRVATPVVHKGRPHMDLYTFEPGTPLAANRFGIFEPAPVASTYVSPLAISLLLMPLVAFDESGARLGMGAGYYDRYLGAIAPPLRPMLVGLAHEAQRAACLPRDDHDVPLDALITEAGWRAFSGRAKVSAPPEGRR